MGTGGKEGRGGGGSDVRGWREGWDGSLGE